jgi:hypothetical protein
MGHEQHDVNTRQKASLAITSRELEESLEIPERLLVGGSTAFCTGLRRSRLMATAVLQSV